MASTVLTDPKEFSKHWIYIYPFPLSGHVYSSYLQSCVYRTVTAFPKADNIIIDSEKYQYVVGQLKLSNVKFYCKPCQISQLLAWTLLWYCCCSLLARKTQFLRAFNINDHGLKALQCLHNYILCYPNNSDCHCLRMHLFHLSWSGSVRWLYLASVLAKDSW